MFLQRQQGLGAAEERLGLLGLLVEGTMGRWVFSVHGHLQESSLKVEVRGPRCSKKIHLLDNFSFFWQIYGPKQDTYNRLQTEYMREALRGVGACSNKKFQIWPVRIQVLWKGCFMGSGSGPRTASGSPLSALCRTTPAVRFRDGTLEQ